MKDPILDTLLIKYQHKTFRVTSLGSNKVIHDVMEDLDLQVSSQEPLLSSKYPHEGPPVLDTLLIKILTLNVQGIFLGVKQGNKWHKRWPCHPSILSETVTILQVPAWTTPYSWHTSIKDINTKLSGYFPLGQTRSSISSWTTLTFKSPLRNHHHPPSTPIKERGFLTDF